MQMQTTPINRTEGTMRAIRATKMTTIKTNTMTRMDIRMDNSLIMVPSSLDAVDRMILRRTLRLSATSP